MFSNYTHNGGGEWRRERKDAITFHTKVMATLTAILRKEMASYLLEPYTYRKALSAVSSENLMSPDTSHCSTVLMQHKICMREGSRMKER